MAAVIYFSQPNREMNQQTKKPQVLKNTEIVAKKIAAKARIACYEIQPQVAYPENVVGLANRAEKEKQLTTFPEVAALPAKVLTEDVLFIGFPNWYGSYPRVLATIFNQYNFSRKTIFPFCTHEGSGFGHSLTDLAKACPQATLKIGLAVRGSRVQKADKAVSNWLGQYYCNCL